MQKRGLSAVIATLLFVLLSLVAVSLVWVVVSRLITQQTSLIKAQNEFFGENIEFTKVQFDPVDKLKVNISIRTNSGNINTETINITEPPPEVYVVSVADLSGSMRECLNMSGSYHQASNFCSNNLHGSWGGDSYSGYCYAIPGAYINQCSSYSYSSVITVDSLGSAQDANNQLLNTIFENPDNQNQVGLTAYNKSVITQFSHSLTNDKATLSSLVNSWQATGSTCICCGINDAATKLQSAPSDSLKTIIVMSDGVANQGCGGNAIQDAIDAACNAYSSFSNLTIYSVALGAEADQDTMAAIAQCGNGENFSASTVDDLVALYQSLAEKIIQTYSSSKKFNYLKVIFYDSASHIYTAAVDVPAPLDTIKYTFDLTNSNLTSPPVKIDLYPVVRSSSGQEITGPLFYEWTKSS